MGEQYAREHGYKVEQFPANWERFGKSAGPIRNEHMVLVADAVVAFWDSKSPGTRHIIEFARRTGTPCKVMKI